MAEEAATTTPEGGNTDTGTQELDAGSEGKVFTQEQVNNFLAAEKRKVQSSYADYEDVKKRAAEFDKLAEASKTELERAQEAAQKATDRTTALQDRLVAAELRAALTGVVADPALVIEDLNLARFVNKDGEVNTEAVEALRAKYAEFSTTSSAVPDLRKGAGQRSIPSTQSADDWIRQMAGRGQ